MAQKFLGLNANNRIEETAVSPDFSEFPAAAAVTASPTDPKLVAMNVDGKVVVADKTSSVTACIGYVTETVAADANIKVYAAGEVVGTGLTPNGPVYLTTAGGFSATAPTAVAGEILQEVGRALTATKWSFNPQEDIKRG